MPLSHDEVVHGKGALLEQMPGDDWRKFANLRLLYAWQWAMPGKKLLFMGCELAQRREWSHDRSLDWHLLEHESPKGVIRWVERLNRMYRSSPPHGATRAQALNGGRRGRRIPCLFCGRVRPGEVLCVFLSRPCRERTTASAFRRRLVGGSHDSDAVEFGG